MFKNKAYKGKKCVFLHLNQFKAFKLLNFPERYRSINFLNSLRIFTLCRSFFTKTYFFIQESAYFVTLNQSTATLPESFVTFSLKAKSPTFAPPLPVRATLPTPSNFPKTPPNERSGQ